MRTRNFPRGQCIVYISLSRGAEELSKIKRLAAPACQIPVKVFRQAILRLRSTFEPLEVPAAAGDRQRACARRVGLGLLRLRHDQFWCAAGGVQ